MYYTFKYNNRIHFIFELSEVKYEFTLGFFVFNQYHPMDHDIYCIYTRKQLISLKPYKVITHKHVDPNIR